MERITHKVEIRNGKHIYIRGYSLTYNQLFHLIREHKLGDDKVKENIEYALTDINFHYYCGLLIAGKYKEVMLELHYK